MTNGRCVLTAYLTYITTDPHLNAMLNYPLLARDCQEEDSKVSSQSNIDASITPKMLFFFLHQLPAYDAQDLAGKPLQIRALDDVGVYLLQVAVGGIIRILTAVVQRNGDDVRPPPDDFLRGVRRVFVRHCLIVIIIGVAGQAVRKDYDKLVLAGAFLADVFFPPSTARARRACCHKRQAA